MSFCETSVSSNFDPEWAYALWALAVLGRLARAPRRHARGRTAGIPLRSGLARRFDAIPPQPTAHIPGSPRPGRSAWRVCERCRWSGARAGLVYR